MGWFLFGMTIGIIVSIVIDSGVRINKDSHGLAYA